MQIKEKKGMGFSHIAELMTRPKNKIAIIVTVVTSADRMVTVRVKPVVSSPPCYHHQPGSLSSQTWLPVIPTMLSSPTCPLFASLAFVRPLPLRCDVLPPKGLPQVLPHICCPESSLVRRGGQSNFLLRRAS